MKQTIKFQAIITILILALLSFSACQKENIEIPEPDVQSELADFNWETNSGSVTSRSACPSGDIVLATQSEVDSFAAAYPNCTLPDGSIFISGEQNSNDPILTLEPLDFLLEIGGDLIIENSALVDLSDLASLQSVGGSLIIKNNPLLENIDEIDLIWNDEGHWFITGNASLTSITIINEGPSTAENITIKNNATLSSLIIEIDDSIPPDWGVLTIKDNPHLSVCAIENICEFLDDGGQATISNNAQGCNALEEVQADCAANMDCGTFAPRTWETNILHHRATIHWDLVNEADNYKVKYRIAGSSNVWKIKQSTHDHLTVHQLNSGTEYEYRLKYHCPNGWSSWGDLEFFTTLP